MNTWKDTLIRALRTFLQAALGYAAANAAGLIEGDGVTKSALSAFLVASVAAGLAALMNLPAKEPNVDFIDGPAVVKKAVESIEELPLAGQDEPGETADVADVAEEIRAMIEDVKGEGDE